MRSDIPTLLSLLEFTEFIEWHPYPFSQINRDSSNNLVFGLRDTKCNRCSFQFAWNQHEWLSRNEIGHAIAQAESLFFDLTGYHPAPKFITDESIQYPRPAEQFNWQGWNTGRGAVKPIHAKSKYIQSVGTEVLAFVADSAVTLSDSDGDGITDTFTVTQAMPVGTTAGEVAVFFITADRLGRPLDIMEIKPIDVAMSGATATITGRSYQLVLPSFQYAAIPSELAYDNAAIYATSLAVYRRTIDTSNSGTLKWDTSSCPTPPCSFSSSTACFGIANAVSGHITPLPAQYSETLAQFQLTYPNEGYRAPDRVSLNYYSGYPRANGRMDSKHARIISLIAISLLPNRIGSCATTNERLFWYRQRPNEKSPEGTTFVVNQREMDENPFSEKTRSSFMAWREMKSLEATWGVVVHQ